MIKDIDYRYFLQDHLPYNEREAWTADQFPDADYRYFHEAGCLVCSLAYLLRYHEIEKENNTNIFNPWTFCEQLIQNNAFSSAADLKISSVSKLYPIGYLGAVKFSKEALLDYVNQGYLCLIVVKGMNWPFHFLALEEWKENDAIVFDPKKGRRFLSEYTEIYQIRLFRRTNHIKTGDDLQKSMG